MEEEVTYTVQITGERVRFAFIGAGAVWFQQGYADGLRGLARGDCLYQFRAGRFAWLAGWDAVKWMLDMKKDRFLAGYVAKFRGLARDKCPFKLEQNWLVWQAGWDVAQREIEWRQARADE